ncbi:hypothetical protein LX32DRAFT_729017 [Colletotrichum zoysiae]|uniref:Protein kinase domain-containing protein n=1 Tax=Colletotrichum zoysiae TaxID=1216348 RepID=A0AAD9HGL1_9PEZI|nr:hypothetical protein LX32DRAFT_729017 [Colletotrichum zoysiae]
MSSSEDRGILHDYQHLYSRGRRLRLSPHKPLRPYGAHVYPLPDTVPEEDMVLSEEDHVSSLTRQVFDPKNAPRKGETYRPDKDAHMEVQIVEVIGSSSNSGYMPGPRKLLCRVLKQPSTSPFKGQQEKPTQNQLLFLKVFDPLFWYKVLDITERIMKVPTLADSAFSDEFGVYHFLYGKHLTGPNRSVFRRTGFFPIAPQFFGGWTTSVSSLSDEFANKSRRVAILALEYVDGVSLDGLYAPSGPLQRTVTLPGAPVRSFHTNQDQRMQIMAQILDGIVTQEHAGVDCTELDPENIIITMRTSDQYLEKPRAVRVGYSRAIIDELRTEPVEMWKEFPLKVHPLRRFRWSLLEDFHGWIPTEWRGPDNDVDDTPDLDLWMLDTFGTLISRLNTRYSPFPRGALLPARPEATGSGIEGQPEATGARHEGEP